MLDSSDANEHCPPAALKRCFKFANLQQRNQPLFHELKTLRFSVHSVVIVLVY